MIIRIFVMIGLVVLGAAFMFFVANVIWLGMREFFKIYGPKAVQAQDDISLKNNDNIEKQTNTQENK